MCLETGFGLIYGEDFLRSLGVWSKYYIASSEPTEPMGSWGAPSLLKDESIHRGCNPYKHKFCHTL